MADQIPDLTPLRYKVSISGLATDAFDRFALGIADWWPRHHKVGQSAIADLKIVPRVGGTIGEIGEDGVETVWGLLTAFDRPARLAFRWTCDRFWRDSEVDISFVQVTPSTVRVRLEHGNLKAIAAHIADLHASFGSPTGWPDILRTFAATAR
jgi:hypothetical protein